MHYEDVALEAMVLKDLVLRDFLRTRYLEPIIGTRPDGIGLVDTLRAYFSVARNGAAASAALGVSRQTVISRLRTVEERIGRPLQSCALALELTVRVSDLDPGD